MESLLQLFGPMVMFTYHCFDRLVINGYLSMLSRPEQIVYFFRHILGIKAITKEALTKCIIISTSSMKSWGRWCYVWHLFSPFKLPVHLNAHHFMERELFRKGIKYRMNDNAFLSYGLSENQISPFPKKTNSKRHTIRPMHQYKIL